MALLNIAQERVLGRFYGFAAHTAAGRVLSQLMVLLDIARATTLLELEHGWVSADQATQRLTLEFLVHLAGTGDLGPEALLHRIHRQVTTLRQRWQAMGQRFQSLGGEVAYLRPAWTAETVFSGGSEHPLFQGAAPPGPPPYVPLTLASMARGMSLFHYMEGLCASEPGLPAWVLVRRVWRDVAAVHAPLAGVAVGELQADYPVDMQDLLVRYFALATQPRVVAALVDALR